MVDYDTGHFLLISCSWSESVQIYNGIARGITVWTIYNDILLPGHTRRNQRVNAALYGLEYSISYRLEFGPLGFQDRSRNNQTWKHGRFIEDSKRFEIFKNTLKFTHEVRGKFHDC